PAPRAGAQARSSGRHNTPGQSSVAARLPLGIASPCSNDAVTALTAWSDRAFHATLPRPQPTDPTLLDLPVQGDASGLSVPAPLKNTTGLLPAFILRCVTRSAQLRSNGFCMADRAVAVTHGRTAVSGFVAARVPATQVLERVVESRRAHAAA